MIPDGRFIRSDRSLTKSRLPGTNPANFREARLNEAAGAVGASRVQSTIPRWSLEGLTIVRYDDANMG